MLVQRPDITSHLENIYIYKHTYGYLTQKRAPPEEQASSAPCTTACAKEPGHFRETANCRHGAGNRFGGA